LAAVTVLGAGGWGTALAGHLAGMGHKVRLWSAFAEHAAQLQRNRENQQFLPGIRIPDSVAITSRAQDAADAEILLFAVPTPYVREIMRRISGSLPRGAVLVSVAKGIEVGSNQRPSEILRAFFADEPLAVLSGPSHAEEVARDLPTTVVVASDNTAVGKRIQTGFSSDIFRVYTSRDIVGVELCGALKNVIGVAAGICEGLGFGDNCKAALMTRGLAEIARLGVKRGADEATFRGLAGMGDLITTCVSAFGRNRALGILIAQGKRIEEAVDAMGGKVAEGVLTTKSTLELAKTVDVEMPIAQEVHNILFERKDPRTAVTDLMTRGLKSETA